jgi:transcriptional regulator with XRE-family HTH domain
MSVIGNNIKKYREIKGFTQEYVSEKVGKTKNVVSNWERGDNDPDAKTIPILCEILGVDANTLYSWSDKVNLKKDVETVSNLILNNPQIKDMIPEINALSKDDMELLKGFIKRLKK